MREEVLEALAAQRAGTAPALAPADGFSFASLQVDFPVLIQIWSSEHVI